MLCEPRIASTSAASRSSAAASACRADARRRTTPNFVEPCIPNLARALPTGPGWLHEPKLDGWRIQIVKHGKAVTLLTRNGHDCSRRAPCLVEAFGALPVNSCIIDGELIADDHDRIGNLWSLHRALNHGRDDLCFVLAFDLLYCDGEDLRSFPMWPKWADAERPGSEAPQLTLDRLPTKRERSSKGSVFF